MSVSDPRPPGCGTDASDPPPPLGEQIVHWKEVVLSAPLAPASVFRPPNAPSSRKTSLSPTACRPGSSPGVHRSHPPTPPHPRSRVFRRWGGGGLLGSDTTSLLPGSSKIRIRDGRAKPIDLLAKYISAEDDDLAVEMHEPYTFLNGLTVADMEDLLEDIQVPPGPAPAPAPRPRPRVPHRPSPPLRTFRLQVYMELEQGKNADFWRDMTTITEDEIAKLRKLEASGKGPGSPAQRDRRAPAVLLGGPYLGAGALGAVSARGSPPASVSPSGIFQASPGATRGQRRAAAGA